MWLPWNGQVKNDLALVIIKSSFLLVRYLQSVADPGEGPGGIAHLPLPSLFLAQTEAQRAEKNFLDWAPHLSSGSGWPGPSPYLKVCSCIIYWCPVWRQGALVSIVLTVFAAVLVIKLLSINFNTESILQRTLKQFGPVDSKKWVKIEVKEHLSVHASHFAGVLSLKLDRSWDVFVLTPRHTLNELVLSLPINVTDGSNELCWIKGRDPFNQNSNQSDQEKWSTSKGGPVFSKLFQLDRTNPLSFGPKFPDILVEWITPKDRPVSAQLRTLIGH